MRRFAMMWPIPESVPPVVAQIGWSLHRVLLDTFSNKPDQYVWYASKAAEHRWSKRHLLHSNERSFATCLVLADLAAHGRRGVRERRRSGKRE
ncbi:DUF1016 N-terminal domain-containing protein [Phytoactinopolyspora halotolerans]|uniref:DUF1016 domain-containing protein n=1 Tax=Phytoactinopolyspora halotolerans TaxID=1981512 RepID=A0A6L9S7U4_9ACTN|nr:DUF1016 domain-containing protein [Phytoactinopolyspora halotolerans]